jgi:hypothetical protein
VDIFPVVLSRVVATVGAPPALDTRRRPVWEGPGEENDVSWLQLPPLPRGASHTTIGGPAGDRDRFSLPSAKKPMDRLSGDQNGRLHLRCR